MNDIFQKVLDDTKKAETYWSNQGPASIATEEFGMSIPTTDAFWDSSASDSWQNSFSETLENVDLSKQSISTQANVGTALGISDLSKMFAETKAKASKQQALGAMYKGVAAAGNLFSSLLTFTSGREIAEKRATNTKLQAENEMAALDNQVLAYKNQITDKFNAVMARNAVTMAAKNLRVSSGALLEQTKDAAYDVTKDIATLESNTELKKIALRSQIAQADVTKELQKSSLAANLVDSLANAGLTVATGGGTMESWGDLFGNLFTDKKSYKTLADVYD